MLATTYQDWKRGGTYRWLMSWFYTLGAMAAYHPEKYAMARNAQVEIINLLSEAEAGNFGR